MKRSLVDQRGCDFVEKRSICLYVYQFCMLFVVYRGNAKNRVSHFIGCVFIQVDVSSGSASFLPKMTGWSTVSRISAVENKSLWTQQSYSQPNTHLQKVDNATICTCTQKYETPYCHHYQIFASDFGTRLSPIQATHRIHHMGAGVVEVWTVGCGCGLLSG